ncbi:hypothetical protein AWH48_15855 [Domibacillus aminovorans]|uniref:Uncharacterized protein n=1 Tax=Domibacillus aminovorans TaxID=29332 RepID=A0A177L0M8_9BACI|nr:hypothetical protein [Domibacillus aminovorans]OAH59218.1 hypothetical protein AWH48_15855 [Domibacillus aminovorans]
MNEIKGYYDLIKAQRKLLWYAQRKHLSAISSKERDVAQAAFKKLDGMRRTLVSRYILQTENGGIMPRMGRGIEEITNIIIT